MLRRIAANAILNSSLGTNAQYLDPDTGQFTNFRVVIHREFDELLGQAVIRGCQISYRASEAFNLVQDQTITLLEPGHTTAWKVSNVVGFNGSLTRVNLKPTDGGC